MRWSMIGIVLIACGAGAGAGLRSTPEGTFTDPENGFTVTITGSTFELNHAASPSDSKVYTIAGSSTYTHDAMPRNGLSNWSCGELAISVTKVVVDGNTNATIHGAKAGMPLRAMWAHVAQSNGKQFMYISTQRSATECTGSGLVTQLPL